MAEIDRGRRNRHALRAYVLADAGYGLSVRRSGKVWSKRAASTWSVGIPRTHKVYTTQAKPIWPNAGRGRPRKQPVPSEPGQDAALVLADRPWRRITWRQGTKGALAARFAAVRVRVADGPTVREGKHLPGEEAWLIGEWRSSGERKYYLSNQPLRTPLRTLAATIKARWVCEQAHQQLKQELGLGAFEGRSWTGLHRHALMNCIAFAYLQHLRIRAAGRGEKLPPNAPGHPGQHCLKSVAPSSRASSHLRSCRQDVRIAAGESSQS